jgi:predicted ATPase
MAKSRNRISGITVRGFKSICTEQHLDIRPLTILAGANSSGKSSFMQPLLLLKQTLESPGDPGALLLDGPNVRFTMASQVLSHIPGKKSCTEFAVRVDLLDDQSLELVFMREEGKGFELGKMVYRSGQDSTVIKPKMEHDEIEKVIPDSWKAMLPRWRTEAPAKVRWEVRRERCFFVFEHVISDESKQRPRFVTGGLSQGPMFVPYVRGIIHLPGLRGIPSRTYPKTAGGPDFQGTFEQYVASVIAGWQNNGGKAQADELGKALEEIGLTWKVKAESVNDTEVELKVGRLPHSKRGGTNDLVSIADVGFGVSQALPVVVALLAAQPGQLVYLEQPEIHLHPLAQRRLARLLKDAVERGVVAVVETHSALLLREVMTLIAKKELPKEDVALHWFRRDERGETTVQTAELDDNGAYGDWPEDFDKTELDAAREYLDIVEAKGAGK